MNEQSISNKKAWEYHAYEFWNSQISPEMLANRLKEDPMKQLKIHKQYFTNVRGKRIGNLCGSCGKRAIALSLLGADTTLFDISEENKKYALETAKYAQTELSFVVGDIYDIDTTIYENYFDMLYMEGGILHYFQDLDRLAKLWYSITKEGGALILSDFHPLRMLAGKGNYTAGSCYKEKDSKDNGSIEGFDYFNKSLEIADVAYKNLLGGNIEDYPSCLLSRHTLSEIINSVINAGFVIKEFIEHPDWQNRCIPGEFTLIATK